ncbi:MAG: hypothetical protein IPH30_02730 [Betaproteobacteria bacterium]|nr:hypothetical protein [Betaproteobacteria bacterium]
MVRAPRRPLGVRGRLPPCDRRRPHGVPPGGGTGAGGERWRSPRRADFAATIPDGARSRGALRRRGRGPRQGLEGRVAPRAAAPGALPGFRTRGRGSPAGHRRRAPGGPRRGGTGSPRAARGRERPRPHRRGRTPRGAGSLRRGRCACAHAHQSRGPAREPRATTRRRDAGILRDAALVDPGGVRSRRLGALAKFLTDDLRRQVARGCGHLFYHLAPPAESIPATAEGMAGFAAAMRRMPTALVLSNVGRVAPLAQAGGVQVEEISFALCPMAHQPLFVAASTWNGRLALNVVHDEGRLAPEAARAMAGAMESLLRQAAD